MDRKNEVKRCACLCGVIPLPGANRPVYILGCRGKGRRLTYVGWTTDVERRFNQHNGGTGARFTRGRAWVLLHVERFATRREAMSREWHLKRDRKFRKQIAQTIAARA
jgi:putative endonuclease